MELYRKELKLAVIKGLDESRGSSNVSIKLTHDTSDEYINYTEQIHIRYLFDNQVKEEILPTNDNGFYIPGKPLSHVGPIELAVHLINGNIELVTNELSFVVKNAPNGTTQVDPSEFTWQQLVDQYVNAKLDTFANKLDLSKFEETVNGSIENQSQNIESFKTEVNANLSNQDKKITDLQNTTKVSLDSQNTKIDNFKSEVNTSLSNQNTSINQTTSAQNSKITTLESRMDTFTRLSEGSTTGDAELQDIRVGANGITYDTAGNAVRGQYSQLKEDLDDVNTIAVNGENVYFYQEHPKSSYYTEKVNLKANQTYTIHVKSSANCSVTIRDKYDNRTEIANLWGEETKEFTPKTDITELILWINDETTPTSQVFVVKIYRGKIKDEIKKIEKTKNIYVEKDGTGDFTSLVDAVNYVNSNTSIKFTVYVGSGTYDLIEELGTDYFEKFKGVGLILDNGAHYIFSSNSKVICNYMGDNDNIKKYFSPFNANSGNHKGFTIENLTLECSDVRYAIHDEGNGQIAPYKNEYINCHITLDNSQNTQGYSQCIGGGLGCASEVIIKNCYFKSIGASNTEIVTYHNVNSSSNDNYRSNVTIDSCYFADTNTCRCSYCGISEKISRMIVSNCSLGAEPRMIAETSSALVNFELIKWNNEIRS